MWLYVPVWDTAGYTTWDDLLFWGPILASLEIALALGICSLGRRARSTLVAALLAAFVARGIFTAALILWGVQNSAGWAMLAIAKASATGALLGAAAWFLWGAPRRATEQIASEFS